MDEHTKQLLSLGREHYAKREYDQAEYLLRQVSEQASGFADVHNMLGVIAHSRGHFTEAEREFEHAVKLNPRYTEAQLNLMVAYNDLGKYEHARCVYAGIRTRDEARGDEPDAFMLGKIANLHADVSQAYVDAGMMEEAISELERAVRLCPQFADLRTRLGVLYRDTGKAQRAREELEAALSANPKYHHARVMLAVLLLTTGEEERAIIELTQLLEDDPDNKSAQMYLRIARAERERA